MAAEEVIQFEQHVTHDEGLIGPTHLVHGLHSAQAFMSQDIPALHTALESLTPQEVCWQPPERDGAS